MRSSASSQPTRVALTARISSFTATATRLALWLCVHTIRINIAKPLADGRHRLQIVFPHEGNIKQLVQEQGLVQGSQDDLASICKDQAVRDLVLKELNATGKKAGFKALEVSPLDRFASSTWACADGRSTCRHCRLSFSLRWSGRRRTAC